ncbi:LysM peptidoglycan-binding domain-containing protein [Metabacillus sp. KIGAM252]|uniref:LysM peptidoglycan-binding domain-containing protein n=1 Tax=Metabacillus flavus TaxID=2823519 RepID=A0ABS5LFI7_9BACI|nr:LysM peptidoglycan-binding domain-containing protein [Metabacillus flavus]
MLKKLIPSALALSLILPAAASAASTYTVVKGDSLWKIAAKTKTGVSELVQANPQLKNPDQITAGQKINIPANVEASTEAEVVSLVNKERAKAGLKPLAVDWELARVAKYKSQDMHDRHYFDHNSPTFGTPFNMMKTFGIKYKTAGENIAQGQTSAQAVMTAWMNSSGHRANILNSSYTHIGVGYVKDGNYWTQAFISK